MIAMMKGSDLRQLIKEFNNRTQIIVASKDNVEQLNIQELLPYSREK